MTLLVSLQFYNPIAKLVNPFFFFFFFFLTSGAWIERAIQCSSQRAYEFLPFSESLQLVT